MDKFSALKEVAEKAKELGGINNYKKGKDAVAAFQAAATPAAILALLAELEDKDKSFSAERSAKVAAWNEAKELCLRAESAEQRIAELEANLSEMTTFRDNALNKALRYWEELLELRAKLATPVRLPDVLFIKVSGSAVPVMHAERVKERVHSAGFKCVGDE